MPRFPNTFAAELTPMTEDMGTEALERIRSKGFNVEAGLTTDMAEQIIVEATSDDVREFCPNDSTNARFGSLESTQDWLGKHGGRGMVLLTKQVEDNEKLLAGWGWTGLETDDPDGGVTFAVRIGERSRGQRVATDYSRLIVAASVKFFEVEPKKLFLETWRSNVAAGKIYGRIGFEETHDEVAARETLKRTVDQPDGAYVWREDGKLYRYDERVHMRFVGENR